MKKMTGVCISSVLMLSLILGACGNSESASGSFAAGEAGQQEQAGGQADEPEGGSQAAQEAGGDNEDIVDITMAFFTAMEPNSDSLQAVEDAINKISEDQINVHVNLLPIGMGSYDQQVNLMIAGNEDLDLMATFFAGSTAFSSMQAQKQCMPLDDLLEEYGQDILGMFEEDALSTCRQGEELMGVPVNKDNVSNFYFTMRTDVLEELGLLDKAQNISSMADVEEILQAVTDNTDLIPIASSQASGPLANTNILFTGDFDQAPVFSRMANDYIGVMGDSAEVSCMYSTEEYKEMMELIRDWYNKGFVYKDSASSTDSNYSQIASGKFFGAFFIAQNATKISTIASCQYDMTTALMYTSPLESSSFNSNVWVVPVTSKEPEAAVKFLNLMYTSPEVVDLLNYGIEGVDYVVKEDGTYGYPENLDAGSVGYHVDMTWLFGNQYLAGVWEGDDPDTREISREINDNAEKSPTFGFSADISAYGTEIAGITSAVNEYVGSLQNGVVEVEPALASLNEKLEAAGMSNVLAGVQEQYDAWLAEQTAQ